MSPGTASTIEATAQSAAGGEVRGAWTGWINVVVAAVIKAILVALYFMHLKFERKTLGIQAHQHPAIRSHILQGHAFR